MNAPFKVERDDGVSVKPRHFKRFFLNPQNEDLKMSLDFAGVTTTFVRDERKKKKTTSFFDRHRRHHNTQRQFNKTDVGEAATNRREMCIEYFCFAFAFYSFSKKGDYIRRTELTHPPPRARPPASNRSTSPLDLALLSLSHIIRVICFRVCFRSAQCVCGIIFAVTVILCFKMNRRPPRRRLAELDDVRERE